MDESPESVELDTGPLDALELDRRLQGIRMLQVALLYGLISVVPIALLSFGAAGKMVAAAGLAANERLVPGLDYGAVVALVAVVLTMVLAPLVTLVFGIRRINDPGIRLAFFASLLVVHPVVICGGAGTTLGAAAPLLLGATPRGHADAPNGRQRAYLYKQHGGNSCGWDVYVGDKLDPVSLQQATVTCDCDSQPDASVLWTGIDPHLEDALGAAYTCPPPSSCDVGAAGASWLALGAVLLVIRRRRTRGSMPA